MKGKLIVIEGTDGSGKGTQVELLKESLQKNGYMVQVVDFPRYGQPSASFVESYLNGGFGTAQEVGPYRGSLFYAVDRYAASHEMKEWLAKGFVVLSNRYVSASMGHQGGKIKDKNERKKFLDWLQHLEYDIFGIPKPDATILLFMPPQLGQQLVDKKSSRAYIKQGTKDIHEADLSHLQDAATAFKEIAQEKKWDIIDCAPHNNLRTKEDIHQEILKKVIELL